MGRCTLADTGPCASPVTIPLQGTASLQDCIDQWHLQISSAMHAFTSGASTILLQLMRFHAEGRGRWKRTVQSLHKLSRILDDVMVPFFADDDSPQCLFLRFKVTSIIAHFGDRADSDHYPCLWKENDTALITDDASVAQLCTAQQLDEISGNAYLICLIRHD